LYLQRKAQQWEPWAIQQVSHHDWRMILEAGRAIGAFSAREWLNEIRVPTSVIVTMRDEIVPLRRQIRLFEEIPGAEVVRIDGGHDAVVARADVFVPALIGAVESALSRQGR
jgi:pimeloyl-ACP methyl ester carboxylesterase